MKKLITGIIFLVLAGAASFYLKDHFSADADKGQVIIGVGNLSVETTFYLFAIIVSLLFILFYILTRALLLLMQSPKIIQNKASTKKQEITHQALIGSLIDSAEGQWEKAESALIKHADESSSPLIFYLSAARSAHAQGAFDKRNDYLRKAYDSTPGSDLTVGITKAELHLTGEEFDQALDTLNRLEQISPGHPVVQRLLHDIYCQLNEWSSLQDLLPDLKKNKALDLDLESTEISMYRELLKQSNIDSDTETLNDIWKSIPDRIKRIPEVCVHFFTGHISAGNGKDIDKDLFKSLTKNHNDELIALWAKLAVSAPDKYYKQTQKLLKKNPDDTVLLRTLAQIEMHLDKSDEALQHLSQSITLHPSLLAYQLSGDLYLQLGQTEKAIECYQKGLELGSGQPAKANQQPLSIERQSEPDPGPAVLLDNLADTPEESDTISDQSANEPGNYESNIDSTEAEKQVETD
ncbi:MAG: tetratricopeptide repeat protein [Gammaproteobacteria bacterium]|nr:tetratricopeptide repeat protein [Gammaproteobacteria bacterium]